MASYSVKCPGCGLSHVIDVKAGPRPGGVTARVYDWVRDNPEGSRTDIIRWAMAEGINPSTALTQYAKARVDLGLVKRAR